MRLLRSTVPDNCDIVLIGDEHFGAKASFTKGVDKVLSWTTKKDDRFFVHMGDAIEARMVDHKYFDIDTISDGQTKPMLQAESVIERYKGTESRCLAWLYGNHEHSLHRYGNLTMYICNQLGIPDTYGGAEAKLRLDNTDGKQICKMYLYHPYKFVMNSNAKDEEQRQANMKARLKWFLQRKAADCLVMACGHSHKLFVVEPVRSLLMTDDGKDIQQEYLRQGAGDAKYIEPNRRWYASTGTFLRTTILDADTYSSQAGYDPVELGYVLVKIRDGIVHSLEEVTV